MYHTSNPFLFNIFLFSQELCDNSPVMYVMILVRIEYIDVSIFITQKMNCCPFQLELLLDVYKPHSSNIPFSKLAANQNGYLDGKEKNTSLKNVLDVIKTLFLWQWESIALHNVLSSSTGLS